MNKESKLSNNTLSVIALTNEFCHAIEHCGECDRDMFVAKMLKLLPRIYMTISDVENEGGFPGYYIESYLDEVAYDQVRTAISQIMAEEDVYLEVFVEDMKYSDTPISAFISENLADLYQEFFNLIQSVKEVDSDARQQLVEQCKENFINYWGQTLCNVLRALNSCFYNDGNQY
ncbi:MAG: DUF5063 domain-containing protein [Bacteroidales bacterium]|nr:DUF5063 domain-containing protein [Candidatus Sodaliphilus fimicaballi]